MRTSVDTSKKSTLAYSFNYLWKDANGPISTKYDASSADIAPLGSISKTDAKAFQKWAITNFDMPIMEEFLTATPTAELLPLSAGVQDDESDAESKFQSRLPSTPGLFFFFTL